MKTEILGWRDIVDTWKTNYSNLIWVKSTDCFFTWNTQVEGWVAIPQKKVESELKAASGDTWNQAIIIASSNDYSDEEKAEAMEKALVFGRGTATLNMLNHLKREYRQDFDVLMGGLEGIKSLEEQQKEVEARVEANDLDEDDSVYDEEVEKDGDSNYNG